MNTPRILDRSWIDGDDDDDDDDYDDDDDDDDDTFIPMHDAE